jgi:hypothetical protein
LTSIVYVDATKTYEGGLDMAEPAGVQTGTNIEANRQAFIKREFYNFYFCDKDKTQHPDINGDGVRDVVVQCSNTNTAAIFSSDGSEFLEYTSKPITDDSNFTFIFTQVPWRFGDRTIHIGEWIDILNPATNKYEPRYLESAKYYLETDTTKLFFKSSLYISSNETILNLKDLAAHTPPKGTSRKVNIDEDVLEISKCRKTGGCGKTSQNPDVVMLSGRIKQFQSAHGKKMEELSNLLRMPKPGSQTATTLTTTLATIPSFLANTLLPLAIEQRNEIIFKLWSSLAKDFIVLYKDLNSDALSVVNKWLKTHYDLPSITIWKLQIAYMDLQSRLSDIL